MSKVERDHRPKTLARKLGKWSNNPAVNRLFRRGSVQQVSTAINQLAASGHFDTCILDGILSSLHNSGLINDKPVTYYLASLYLQLGDNAQASELLKHAGKATRELKWFASLMLHAIDGKLPLPMLSSRERRCLDYLGSRVQVSDNAMANLFFLRDSFAVVGNAPGSLVVDSGDNSCKVFFNEYQKNPRLQGNPTLHVVTPSWNPINPVTVRHLCITGNNIFHRRSRVWRKFLCLPEYEQVYTLPQSLWRELSQELEAPPSAGMALLAYVADYVELTGKAGLVGGFSSVVENTNHSYDAVPLSSRHNWSGEIHLRQKYLSSIKKGADSLSVC